MLVLALMHLRAAPERATGSRLLAAAQRADSQGTVEQPVARAAEPQEALVLQEALLPLPLALLLPLPAPLLARRLARARWPARLDR
jgi:hypothetical protein